MKNLAAAAILALFAVSAKASDFSFKPGLDAGSIGALTVHDFKSAGTVSGFTWDALHVAFKGDDVAFAGPFAGRRDGDRHWLAGPSFGTPGGDLASVADWAQQYVDWPWLKVASGYGSYLHAYLNVGWDLSNAAHLHASPDLLGLGGVVKFGK